MRRLDAYPLLLVCLIGGLLAGCSGGLRRFFFESSREPPPPTSRVRRDLHAAIEDLERALATARARAAYKDTVLAVERKEAPPIEGAGTWSEARTFLAMTPTGQPDWVKSLREGHVAPRNGPDALDPDQLVLKLDMRMETTPVKTWHVDFSHEAHTEWVGCGSCHPNVFSLGQRTESLITMGAMDKGEFCGACHGRAVFGGQGECSHCHTDTGIPEVAPWQAEVTKPVEAEHSWEKAAELLPKHPTGGADWVKAVTEEAIAPRANPDPTVEGAPVAPFKDIVLVPDDGNEMFRVVFPHKQHTEWLVCGNCHPGIYEMRWGAGHTKMARIEKGESCGVCHNGVAFGLSPTTCVRCHPGLG